MNWRYVSRILLLLITVVLASGCVRRPKKVLSNSKTAAVIADMELAEAYLQTQPSIKNQSELRAEITAGVLQNHGVSREEFDSTMNWYGRNIDEYYKLDAEVNRTLAKRQRDLAKRGGGVVEQQTAIDDIWPYKRTALIWEGSGSNVLEFSLPAGEVSKGSSLEWSMRLRQPVESYMLLGVEYKDGEISYANRTSNGQKKLETSLQTDTARSITRVFGHFLVKKNSEMPVFIDSIILRPVPFDSTRYHRVFSQRKLRKPSRPKPAVADKTDIDSTLNSK